MAAKWSLPMLSLWMISPISEQSDSGASTTREDERFGESKDGLTLVRGHASGNLDDVLVEGAAHEFEIAKDEGLLWIESAGDDVLGILLGVLEHIWDGQILLEQVLFVVREHDDQRHVEDFLYPPAVTPISYLYMMPTTGQPTL